MEIEFVTNYNDWSYLLIDGKEVYQGHDHEFTELLPYVMDARNNIDEPIPMTLKITNMENGDEDGVEMAEYVRSAEHEWAMKEKLSFCSASVRSFLYHLYNETPVPDGHEKLGTIKTLVGRGYFVNDKLTETGTELAAYITKTWKK